MTKTNYDILKAFTKVVFWNMPTEVKLSWIYRQGKSVKLVVYWFSIISPSPMPDSELHFVSWCVLVLLDMLHGTLHVSQECLGEMTFDPEWQDETETKGQPTRGAASVPELWSGDLSQTHLSATPEDAGAQRATHYKRSKGHRPVFTCMFW